MADKKSGRPWAPKQMFWSAAGMAVLVLMGGFWGLDWVTNSTAETMAQTATKKTVLEHLVPICVEQAKTASAEDLTALKEENSWAQKQFVMDKGWATMPGATSPVSAIASPCAEAILSG